MFNPFKRQTMPRTSLSRYVGPPREMADLPVHQGRPAVISSFRTIDGNPRGGISYGRGIDISWQDGVQEPNGAILEDLLEIAVQRMQFYQEGKFACRENALVITKLEEALGWLNRRTHNRRARGVEGTYNV